MAHRYAHYDYAAPLVRPLCVSGCVGGKLMAQICAHYAPLVRPLCAHYVFETVWGETDGPYMRPLCAYCAPTMRPLCV